MAIDKGVFVWSGFPGGPGYSVFYATPGMGIAGDLRAFFDNIKTYIPSSVSIDPPESGDTIDEATGQLTATWTGASLSNVIGSSNDVYAGGVGASITWLTGGVVNGRRVAGRTFLVPLASNAYDLDGSLTSLAYTALDTAASALVSSTAGDLLVWHRPVGGVGGSAHPVTGYRIRDRVAVLSSRRA